MRAHGRRLTGLGPGLQRILDAFELAARATPGVGTYTPVLVSRAPAVSFPRAEADRCPARDADAPGPGHYSLPPAGSAAACVFGTAQRGAEHDPTAGFPGAGAYTLPPPDAAAREPRAHAFGRAEQRPPEDCERRGAELPGP